MSISYRRIDYFEAIKDGQDFRCSLPDNIDVLHGHFYYKELQQVHQKYHCRLVCWFRHPVARVVSNYRHFVKRNSASNSNGLPRCDNVSLISYARREECRNRMTRVLEGLRMEDFFFCGFLESFSDDINRLSRLLDWPRIDIPHLNAVAIESDEIDDDIIFEINMLNRLDMEMFKRISEHKRTKIDL